MRTEYLRAVVLLLLLFIDSAVWFQFPVVQAENSCQCLSVHFLDVGQGDAILIKTPDGVEMLVDGGRDTSVLRALSDTRSFFDRNIDVMVATHPDLDHIGGLVDVLERYEIGTIIETTNVSDTSGGGGGGGGG
ncbi:MAG: MBL fold metallo-hydrolase, partial [Patescibacteria group bacterium]